MKVTPMGNLGIACYRLKAKIWMSTNQISEMHLHEKRRRILLRGGPQSSLVNDSPGCRLYAIAMIFLYFQSAKGDSIHGGSPS